MSRLNIGAEAKRGGYLVHYSFITLHPVCAMVYNDSIPHLTVLIPTTTQGTSPFQDHTSRYAYPWSSQASSIVFVYCGSGCDTANEPTLGNMEKLLRLSAPKHGLNAVLGRSCTFLLGYCLCTLYLTYLRSLVNISNLDSRQMKLGHWVLTSSQAAVPSLIRTSSSPRASSGSA